MSGKPLVVAVDMGYGHLRAARAIARAAAVDVHRLDVSPLASAREERWWKLSRVVYEGVSRGSQIPGVGLPLHAMLGAMTHIPPLHPNRDLSAPTAPVRAFDRLAARGFGERLVGRLKQTGETLVTTFYAPAIIADRAGLERVVCVITDSDLNRMWVPADARRTRIRFCVPGRRAAQRLRAYGVPEDRIRVTGFPLPVERFGDLTRSRLAARLARLDPTGVFRDRHGDEIARVLGTSRVPDRVPHLTLAVGGAGAQAHLARRLLRGLAAAIDARQLRVTLVAGVRPEVAALFRDAVSDAGLDARLGGDVTILHEPDLERYFERFDALLADTDVLWTKPSELVFFAALGIPLLLSPPIGAQETYNRRFVVEHGAGVMQRDPRVAAQWLDEMLRDGTLAGAAWSGYVRLPRDGTREILEVAAHS
ncbi:MAG: hypothetical protein HYR85_09490 [Planctomycetes bacterium]|nr:hypothetical protein [Planctomycetota bacterium]MBI3847667.1 hypothetical protein [Planctomycetota bacterium]